MLTKERIALKWWNAWAYALMKSEWVNASEARRKKAAKRGQMARERHRIIMGWLTEAPDADIDEKAQYAVDESMSIRAATWYLCDCTGLSYEAANRIIIERCNDSLQCCSGDPECDCGPRLCDDRSHAEVSRSILEAV